MKKSFIKLAFVLPLFILSSCANGGSYMKTVAFWHFGNFLQFLLIAAIAGVLFLVFTKVQSIDDTLKEIMNELHQRQADNSIPVSTSNQVNAQVVQEQRSAVKSCPDCGAMLSGDASSCPNCGCPLV